MEWSGVEWSGAELSGVELSGEWRGAELSAMEWSGVEWSGVEMHVRFHCLKGFSIFFFMTDVILIVSPSFLGLMTPLESSEFILGSAAFSSS